MVPNMCPLERRITMFISALFKVDWVVAFQVTVEESRTSNVKT